MWAYPKIGRFVGLATLTLLATLSLVPQSASAATKADGNATVAVTVTPRQSNGDTLGYDITANNVGSGIAYYTNVVIPIDASALQVVGTSLSGTPSWLATNTSSLIEFRIERLYSNESATLSVDFHKLSADAAWSSPVQFSWGDAEGNHAGTSNTPQSSFGNAALNVRVSGDNASFSGSMFAANEPVTIWYNAPSGDVVGVSVAYNNTILTGDSDDDLEDNARSSAIADTNGEVWLAWNLNGLPTGSYSLVARGNWTGITAVGSFQR